MPRFPSIVSSLSLLALVACSSSGPAASGKPAAAVPAPVVQADDSRASLRQTCVATFERARACTDDYLDMLVDTRVRLDRPAGIAARDQASGRASLVAAAHAEWADDSTDAAIGALCDHVANATPDARLDDLRAGAERCLGEAECGGFASCMRPITEAQLSGPH
jgi:hypothetical protein